jgi:tRNA threonylcarbamoyladenosine modification (KEOPS) complex  Pcc1 subunit
MNFDDFKDNVVSLIRSDDELVQKILNASSICILMKDGNIDVVNRENTIDENANYIRSVSKDNDYVALVVFSMVAEMNSEEDAESMYENLEGKSQEEMMDYLRDRDMLQECISIRFEQKLNKESNSLVTLYIDKNRKLNDKNIELFDDQLSGGHNQSPFGGDLFDYDES